MIVQPDRKERNETELFYENEARRIAMLNEIFGNVELSEAEMQTLIWLAGWAENTVENVVSAIRKAMTADAKRRELPPRPEGGKRSTLRFGRCRADVHRTSCTPRRAQRQLLMDGTAVESAFALLLAKVTKPRRRIRR